MTNTEMNTALQLTISDSQIMTLATLAAEGYFPGDWTARLQDHRFEVRLATGVDLDAPSNDYLVPNSLAAELAEFRYDYLADSADWLRGAPGHLVRAFDRLFAQF